jgi:hypothetical protein
LALKRTGQKPLFPALLREDIIKQRAIEGDTEAQLAALEQTLRGEIAIAGD